MIDETWVRLGMVEGLAAISTDRGGLGINPKILLAVSTCVPGC